MPNSISQNRRRRIQTNNSNLYKCDALSGIKSIKPKLHWIALSGDYHKYSNIRDKLGTIHPDSRPIFQKDRRQYKKWGYIKGGKYIIYWDPKEGLFDYFILATNNSSPEALSDLRGEVGDLKVSSVEYTIDFFCKSPDTVNQLYYLFRRYAYFSKKLQVGFIGGQFAGWDEPRNENSVYRIGQDIKIYERGRDGLKIPGKGWDYDTVNRVRFEITLRRGGRGHNKLLKEHNLEYLSDLLENPKFGQIMLDKINFRAFDGRNRNLPTEKEDYLGVIEDKRYRNRLSEVGKYVKNYNLGALETFQVQYILAHKLLNVRNPAQYMIEPQGFTGLLNNIKTAVGKFEKKWAGTIKKRKKAQPQNKLGSQDWEMI